MEDLIRAVINGIPFGCVYALLAIGLVLTYKTSGVFNLAFGAQAFAVAAVFYDVRARHEWPLVPAVLFAVVLVGPLIGLILDRWLFRYLRTASTVAKLVTSLGLLVAIPEVVKLWFGGAAAFGAPAIVPDAAKVYRLDEFAIEQKQVATVVITVLVMAALTVLFRRTAIGLRMRAVVESPRLTELAGIDADRVSTVSWMLSSFLAGLAGVLLAPLFASLNAQDYFTLLVAAIAAAAFASLTSIPMAFAGGILLGVLQEVISVELPTGSILATGLRPSFPFVALFLLLLFWPGLRRREATDPLAGVDPPPPALASLQRNRQLTIATRATAVVFLGVVAWGFFAWFDGYWRLLIIQAIIFATIFLSITVITGLAGQVSLCQAAFAAIGAFGTAQLAERFGMSVLLTMVIGALLAALVGVLIALPSLRLGGIFLTLATLAFAFFFEYVLVPLDWVSGGATPTEVPRPTLGPIDFTNDNAFAVLCVAVLVVASTMVIFVRRGTTGRYLQALRGSEVASASIGISANRARITAFALSAGLAGLGGGLLATYKGFANYQESFTVFFGLVWVVLVVSLSPRTVEGAVQAGFALWIFPALTGLIADFTGIGFIDLTENPGVVYILFGLGAFGYAKHPEGSIEFQKRIINARVQRWLFKDDPSTPPHASPPPTDPQPAAHAPGPTRPAAPAGTGGRGSTDA